MKQFHFILKSSLASLGSLMALKSLCGNIKFIILIKDTSAEMSLKNCLNILKKPIQQSNTLQSQPEFSLHMNVLHLSGLADPTTCTSKS